MPTETDSDKAFLEVTLLGFHQLRLLCKCGHTVATHYNVGKVSMLSGFEKCICRGSEVSSEKCTCTEFKVATNLDYIIIREKLLNTHLTA